MPDFVETIFITGFPGFIAGRLLSRLATPETQVFVLVQAAFLRKAAQDIEKIAAQKKVPLENFAIIQGDITKENLGMTTEDLTIVRQETTSVFHLAAVYDLAVPKETAFLVNVEGTKNVNKLAKSIENLRRYNYISTCYVAGKRTGAISESDLDHSAGFRNYYEETKYLAELDVKKLKSELPITIYRPSVVLGDSKTGETAKYDGIYYLINYLLKAPGLLRFVNVGNKEVRLNLVPVDFVVDAIAALSKDEKAEGKTLQIADPDPVSTADIFDEIAKALTGKGSAWVPPASLVERFLMLPFSPALNGLPHSAVPYFFLAQTYDTKISRELLSSHGVKCPPFSGYVRNLLDFVKKNPKL